MSTYTGWDHKWDLLVIESVHIISVIGWVGGLRDEGEGEVFTLKRQHGRCSLGHWKTNNKSHKPARRVFFSEALTVTANSYNPTHLVVISEL